MHGKRPRLIELALFAAGCSAACAGAQTIADADAGERLQWRAQLGWPQACDDAFVPPEPDYGGVVVYALDGGARLVEVSCALGAYQGAHRYYLLGAPGSAPVALRFRVLIAQRGALRREPADELWGDAEIDAAAATLTITNRYRAGGDCGTYMQYRIAAQPEVLVARAKAACDGKSGGGPEHWPALQVD